MKWPQFLFIEVQTLSILHEMPKLNSLFCFWTTAIHTLASHSLVITVVSFDRAEFESGLLYFFFSNGFVSSFYLIFFIKGAYPEMVITRYSWEDNLRHLILSLIIPNVIFAISIGVLSYWYCPCCDRKTTRVYTEKFPDNKEE